MIPRTRVTCSTCGQKAPDWRQRPVTGRSHTGTREGAMGIDYFTVDGVMVIRIYGSLDNASADRLREGEYAALRGHQRTVFVNLGNVPGIQTAGLCVLAHIHRVAHHDS